MFDGNYGMNLHTYSSQLKPGTLVIFVSKSTKRVENVWFNFIFRDVSR